MRFGRAACKAHFGNQQLTHRYLGEVKGRATDDQGVTMVSVLWDGDSTEVETNEKHVYPLQDDDEPYEFDEEASIKEYEDEILMSKKPKAKKTKKGAPSSGTGAGGSSGTQASHAPSRPVDPKLPKFILPEVEWNAVPEFKNQRPGPEVRAKLRVPRDANTSAWDEGDYLLHALPDFWAESTVRVNAHSRMRGRSLCTVDELKVFVGIMLAMCVQPLKRRSDYWKVRPSAADLFPPADFNRLGMSEDRWERIWSALSFECNDDEDDKWDCIRKFIEDWNENSAGMLHCGWLLCLDESMSRWLSRTKGGDKGIPHSSFVKRKPEPTGTEMKTLADCDTGCIVQVEVQEGKAANKISDAAGVDGIVYQHHIGVSLRLTKPWWKSGRAVIGDSWFASVSNIIAHLQKDMYFVGNIKTATRGFCKNALTDKCGVADGSMLSMEAEIEVDVPGLQGTKRKIHATALREGPRMLRHLCTAVGSSDLIESTDEVEDEQGQREDVKSMVQEPTYIYRSGAPSIDVHNHIRQGILAIEKVIVPRHDTALPSWAKRVWSTLLGMSATNAYNMHTRFGSFHHEHFMLYVATAAACIINKYKVVTVADLPGADTDYELPTKHYTRKFSDVGMFKKRKVAHNRGGGRVTYEDSRRSKQLKCTICGKDTTTFCNGCGTKKGMHGNECLAKHWQNINNKPRDDH